MSYNRATAKTRVVARVQETRTSQSFRMPNLGAWEPPALPLPARCRHCGSKVLACASRCLSCWRNL